MIRAAAGVLVRSLLELAIVAFLVGALCALLAYRTGRRLLWADGPDSLERYAERFARAGELIAAAARARART